MNKEEYKKYIFTQLDNVLKGDALRVIEDKKESPENKKNKMEVIEDVKKYLNNYYENIKFIHQAKDYSKRIDDDLR